MGSQAYRYRTDGQDNWQTRSGYRHVSPQYARLESSDGGPTLARVIAAMLLFQAVATEPNTSLNPASNTTTGD